MKAVFEVVREYSNDFVIWESNDNITGPHFHSNIEIIYVISGEITVNINGVSQQLKSGDLAISSKFDLHSYYTSSHSLIYVLIIPVEKVKYYSTLLNTKTLKSNYIIDNNQTSEVYTMITDMYALFQQNRDINMLIEKGFSYLILGKIIDIIGLTERERDVSTELSRQILVFLQNNYLEEIPISKLANKLGYNKQYLSKFFNTYLGCSYSSYINSLRIRHATQLIADGETSMTDIALKSGFGTSRTFNRAFIKAYGITPTQYKNQLDKFTSDSASILSSL